MKIETVDDCNTLDELTDKLGELEARWRDDDTAEACFHGYLAALGINVTEFPVFGGHEPDDTEGVWSWDEDWLLVTGDREQFSVVHRATREAG